MSYVAAACELGSISKASVQLGVSQPSLTRQIKALERKLNVELLHRDARGVHPTAAGTALIRQHERIRTEVRRVEEVVHAAVRGQEIVRIAVPPGMPGPWLRSLLERLHTMNPHIVPILVDLSSPETEDAIARHTVDIGFMHYAPQGPRTQPLFEQSLGVALRPTSPRYSSATAVTELTGATLLAHSSWEVSGLISSESDLSDALGVDAAIRYRRFADHVEIFCDSTEADGVILTETTATVKVPGWRWLPLEFPTFQRLKLTTYAAFNEPPTPAVSQILHASINQ